MHSAPAVSYPVGRSSMRTLLYLVPCLLGGAVCLAWSGLSAGAELTRLLVLLLWLAPACLAVWACLRPARGQLAWDGQSWSWEDRGGRQVGSLHVRLDWQSGLLLEFQPLQGWVVWLWPERGMAPAFWDGLRRAVFAPPVADPLAGPEVRA
jgi:toxin CptA